MLMCQSSFHVQTSFHAQPVICPIYFTQPVHAIQFFEKSSLFKILYSILNPVNYVEYLSHAHEMLLPSHYVQ